MVFVGYYKRYSLIGTDMININSKRQIHAMNSDNP